MIATDRNDAGARALGYDRADAAALMISIHAASEQFCKPPLSLTQVYSKAIDAAQYVHQLTRRDRKDDRDGWEWQVRLSASHVDSLAFMIVKSADSAGRAISRWLDERGL